MDPVTITLNVPLIGAWVLALAFAGAALATMARWASDLGDMSASPAIWAVLFSLASMGLAFYAGTLT